MPHVPCSNSDVSLLNVGTGSPDRQQKRGVASYFNLQRKWHTGGVSWSSLHCSVLNCRECQMLAGLMASSVPVVSVSDGLQALGQLLLVKTTSDIAAKCVEHGRETSIGEC